MCMYELFWTEKHIKYPRAYNCACIYDCITEKRKKVNAKKILFFSFVVNAKSYSYEQSYVRGYFAYFSPNTI